MKAVIYARYSSDNQREESIEGQIRECNEYAERNGITVLCSYIDRALSARTADRPDFQRMIRDSEKGLFDVVLVWKLDRFSRDRYDSAHYKHILKKNGVKVLSAKENISEGPEGIILESMLEGYAEYYSAELSEKIHRGQKENALKCKNNGGWRALGYTVDADGSFVIDPLTAPIVREIFTRYADGETITDIAQSLNDRGLTTTQGRPFRCATVSIMLKNRKYIGEYRYGGVVVPNGVPAIIDEETFARVQERLEKNRKAPAKAKAADEYLLTTKLFCGTCGRLMVGESGTSGTKGVKHYYYKCGGAKRHLGCKRKAIKKQWIERAVVLCTVKRVLQDQEIERIAESIVKLQEQEDATLPALRHQLQECEKGIENMLDAIQAGVLTSSTKERLDRLEAQRDDLKIAILQAQMRRPTYKKEQIVSWISRFKFGNADDPAYQKGIIDTFINSVYVFDDKLVFTFNYHDGTETITLKEIEEAFGSDLTQHAPGGAYPHRLGALQEAGHSQPGGGDCGRAVGRAGNQPGDLRVGRHGGVSCAAVYGFFRHDGHRAGGVWLLRDHPAGEFPRAVFLPEHPGILAPVAHHPGHMASGLYHESPAEVRPVHPAGSGQQTEIWQEEREEDPLLCGDAGAMVLHGAVAREQLEIHYRRGLVVLVRDRSGAAAGAGV